MSKKFITEIVDESYQNWFTEYNLKKGKTIVINAGTGQGKTYFALKHLVASANRALYLTPRTALHSEIRKKISDDGDGKDIPVNIDVMNYQRLEEIIKKGDLQKWRRWVKLQYEVIIVDEYHYFTQDSDFNPYTLLSYNFIRNCNGAKIFLSATGECMLSNILEKDFEIDNVIEAEANYSYIDSVICYQNAMKSKTQRESNDYARDKILDIIEKDKNAKIIYFVNSISKIKELYKNDEIRKVAEFFFSESQAKDDSLKTILTKNPFIKVGDTCQTFSKQVLITTTALDVGVDLKDRNIKYMFLDVRDINLAKQCIGRKRPLDEADKCVLYIHDIERYKFKKSVRILEEAIKKAELEKRRLSDGCITLDKTDECYKEHLEQFAYNEELVPYNCLFIDWINSHGEIKFNELKYARLQERLNYEKTILSRGFINVFCEKTGLKITSGIYNKSTQIFDRNERELDVFINENLNIPLDKEKQECLINLCCILNSRKTGIIRQHKRIAEFLKEKFNVTLKNQRNQKIWIIHKEGEK